MTPGENPAPSGATPEITFGDIGRAGWKRLKEMRTVFQLLVIIAIAALLCAVVPQNEDPQGYLTRYGQFLGNIVLRLGLDHVHSTGWFLLLLGVLLLSLVACSGRLWKEASLRWGIPTADAAGKKLQSGSRLSGVTSLAVDEAVTAVAPALRKHGYHSLSLGAEDGKRLLYVHKHRFSAWGQALAHYSVFLIALGSVMGAIHGLSLDQNVTIMEGETFHSEDGSVPFGIRVDGFTIAQDPANGAVKNYYSKVRLFEGEKEVLKGTISVNHPLRYHGYFISQSDWGLGEAKIEITSGGKTEEHGFPLERAACPGTDEQASMWGVPQEQAALYLPDGHAALVATGFYADAVREGGKTIQRNSEYPGTPALNLTYISGIPGLKPTGPAQGPPKHGMKDLGWLLPGESLPLDDGQIKFVGITKSTGLGIRKDVGLPLVWIGFIASILGLMMIFYFPLQRSVVSLEPQGQGRTAIALAAYGRAGDLADDSNQVWQDMLKRLGGRSSSNSGAGVGQEESTSE